MICNNCHLREARHKKYIKQEEEFKEASLCSVCFNEQNKKDAYKAMKVSKEFKREEEKIKPHAVINLAELSIQRITKEEESVKEKKEEKEQIFNEEVFSVLLDESSDEDDFFITRRRKKSEYQNKCPVCGYLESTIKETGYVGCANCYNYFRETVEESIAIYQGKNKTHRGKNIKI